MKMVVGHLRRRGLLFCGLARLRPVQVALDGLEVVGVEVIFTALPADVLGGRHDEGADGLESLEVGVVDEELPRELRDFLASPEQQEHKVSQAPSSLRGVTRPGEIDAYERSISVSPSCSREISCSSVTFVFSLKKSSFVGSSLIVLSLLKYTLLRHYCVAPSCSTGDVN